MQNLNNDVDLEIFIFILPLIPTSLKTPFYMKDNYKDRYLRNKKLFKSFMSF